MFETIYFFLKKHIENSLIKLDNRLEAIESIPKLIEKLRTTLCESEQTAVAEAMTKLDTIQSQLIDMFQARKAGLVNDIRNFYRANKKYFSSN